MALDIGPRSVRLFGERLRKTGTVIWNGPVGVAEIRDFSDGTKKVGEAIAASGGYTLVGGGDTIAAIERVVSSLSTTATRRCFACARVPTATPRPSAPATRKHARRMFIPSNLQRQAGAAASTSP